MSLRRQTDKLLEKARSRLAFIDLPDGSPFCYDPERTQMELFLYGAETVRAMYKGEKPPAPPRILEVIAGLPNREDRERMFWAAYGPTEHPAITFDVAEFLDAGHIEHLLKPRASTRQDAEDRLDNVTNVRSGKPPW